MNKKYTEAVSDFKALQTNVEIYEQEMTLRTNTMQAEKVALEAEKVTLLAEKRALEERIIATASTNTNLIHFNGARLSVVEPDSEPLSSGNVQVNSNSE